MLFNSFSSLAKEEVLECFSYSPLYLFAEQQASCFRRVNVLSHDTREGSLAGQRAHIEGRTTKELKQEQMQSITPLDLCFLTEGITLGTLHVLWA